MLLESRRFNYNSTFSYLRPSAEDQEAWLRENVDSAFYWQIHEEAEIENEIFDICEDIENRFLRTR